MGGSTRAVCCSSPLVYTMNNMKCCTRLFGPALLKLQLPFRQNSLRPGGQVQSASSAQSPQCCSGVCISLCGGEAVLRIILCVDLRVDDVTETDEPRCASECEYNNCGPPHPVTAQRRASSLEVKHRRKDEADEGAGQGAGQVYDGAVIRECDDEGVSEPRQHHSSVHRKMLKLGTSAEYCLALCQGRPRHPECPTRSTRGSRSAS